MGSRLVLGVEGGGTKTEWALVRLSGADAAVVVESGQLPAANLRRVSDDTLRGIFSQLSHAATHIGVYLAGCLTEADRRRLDVLARAIWPQAAVSVGSDRDSSLATAFGDGDGVVVIAGTGSAVTGRRAGRIEKAGGRGHLLGDKGGAYDLVQEGLCAAVKSHDLRGRATPLAASVLRALALDDLDELVAWTQSADTAAIGGLAPLVFAAAAGGDPEAQAVIEDGARALAQDTAAVGQRLHLEAAPVRLAGGLFLNQPAYVERFESALEGLWPGAAVALCPGSGALGAAWLAGSFTRPRENASAATATPIEEIAAALTEASNPRSEQLDELGVAELVALFVDEEQHVEAALRAAATPLGRALEIVASSLQSGGRLFYIGAGTSGRLGVLDASEIPPTFGVAAERVQGIIAGGAAALHTSVEGAEDRGEDGARAVVDRGVRAGDVVCGITASGRTPFVLGALFRARNLGARTLLLTCNPDRTPSPEPWDAEVDLHTGPEILTGSTRLKAATATKVALNILSTGAMIRLGRVKGNLMVDLRASSAKLRDRAARLVAQQVGCSYREALARLEACGWEVRRAAAQQ